MIDCQHRTQRNPENKVRKYFLLLPLLLIFNSYAESKARCIKSVQADVMEFNKASAIEEISNYNNTNGFIPVIIKQRKMLEIECSKIVSCYDNEPDKSNAFLNCLNGFDDATQD